MNDCLCSPPFPCQPQGREDSHLPRMRLLNQSGRKVFGDKRLGWIQLSAQVYDDATVEDVYKYISEKIGLKPGRKLVLTSGCILLHHSRQLLQQAQGGEISFIVQRSRMTLQNTCGMPSKLRPQQV